MSCAPILYLDIPSPPFYPSSFLYFFVDIFVFIFFSFLSFSSPSFTIFVHPPTHQYSFVPFRCRRTNSSQRDAIIVFLCFLAIWLFVCHCYFNFSKFGSTMRSIDIFPHPFFFFSITFLLFLFLSFLFFSLFFLFSHHLFLSFPLFQSGK